MGKDEQNIKSIKIIYNINNNGLFTIEYWLEDIDFDIWLEIFNCHKENLYEYFLYNKQNEVIEKPMNSEKNIYYRLESNDENLHSWIDYIPFIENSLDNSLTESVNKNTKKL